MDIVLSFFIPLSVHSGRKPVKLRLVLELAKTEVQVFKICLLLLSDLKWKKISVLKNIICKNQID
jgi:hypothetical protein